MWNSIKAEEIVDQGAYKKSLYSKDVAVWEIIIERGSKKENAEDRGRGIAHEYYSNSQVAEMWLVINKLINTQILSEHYQYGNYNNTSWRPSVPHTPGVCSNTALNIWNQRSPL